LNIDIEKKSLSLEILQIVVAFSLILLLIPSPSRALSYKKQQKDGIEITIKSVPQKPQINKKTVYSMVLKKNGRLFDPKGLLLTATKDSKMDESSGRDDQRMDHGVGGGKGHEMSNEASGGMDNENGVDHETRDPVESNYGSSDGMDHGAGSMEDGIMATAVPTGKPGNYKAIVKYTEAGVWNVEASLVPRKKAQSEAYSFSFTENVEVLSKSFMTLNVLAGFFILAFITFRGQKRFKSKKLKGGGGNNA